MLTASWSAACPSTAARRGRTSLTLSASPKRQKAAPVAQASGPEPVVRHGWKPRSPRSRRPTNAIMTCSYSAGVPDNGRPGRDRSVTTQASTPRIGAGTSATRL